MQTFEATKKKIKHIMLKENKTLETVKYGDNKPSDSNHESFAHDNKLIKRRWYCK